MNEAIGVLIGKRVQVFSNKGHKDEGILESYDHPWLRVRLDGNAIACFQISKIRLVKQVG